MRHGKNAILTGLFLGLTACAAAAQEQQPVHHPPALSELDALRMEKAALEVQLLQSRMELLNRSASLLQWEAAEVQRQLGTAAALRDTLIRQAAERAKVDPAKCKPVVGTTPGWKCD